MAAPTTRRKYGNVRTLGPSPYGGHRWYASKVEAAKAVELDLRSKAKDLKFWEPQYVFSLDIGNIHITDYIADFRVVENNGTVDFIDCKGGPLLPIFKLKMNLMAALYPEVTIRIVR